tara:strand:- start:797 stop:1456 length:660 start_codon:yes stop_codon:yes gene_type:complete
MNNMIIAVDGTAASGKGSLAKNLSKSLNLLHLDTGILYRILAYKAVSFDYSKNEKYIDNLINCAKQLTIKEVETIKSNSSINLRSGIISQKSSEIATFEPVRNELTKLQRSFSNIKHSKHKGIVLDGRDIGTVVFPNAKFKFYLDADIRIRAERRTEELIHLNYKVIYHEVLEDLIIRDERDKNRKIAPLRKAKDAIFIDTSLKSEEKVLQEALDFINN